MRALAPTAPGGAGMRAGAAEGARDPPPGGEAGRRKLTVARHCTF